MRFWLVSRLVWRGWLHRLRLVWERSPGILLLIPLGLMLLFLVLSATASQMRDLRGVMPPDALLITARVYLSVSALVVFVLSIFFQLGASRRSFDLLPSLPLTPVDKLIGEMIPVQIIGTPLAALSVASVVIPLLGGSPTEAASWSFILGLSLSLGSLGWLGFMASRLLHVLIARWLRVTRLTAQIAYAGGISLLAFTCVVAGFRFRDSPPPGSLVDVLVGLNGRALYSIVMLVLQITLALLLTWVLSRLDDSGAPAQPDFPVVLANRPLPSSPLAASIVFSLRRALRLTNSWLPMVTLGLVVAVGAVAMRTTRETFQTLYLVYALPMTALCLSEFPLQGHGWDGALSWWTRTMPIAKETYLAGKMWGILVLPTSVAAVTSLGVGLASGGSDRWFLVGTFLVQGLNLFALAFVWGHFWDMGKSSMLHNLGVFLSFSLAAGLWLSVFSVLAKLPVLTAWRVPLWAGLTLLTMLLSFTGSVSALDWRYRHDR